MEFTPERAINKIEMYRTHLLKGDVLKIDCGGHDYVDIIPRECINEWDTMKNVGCTKRYTSIGRYPEQLKSAIDSLKKAGYIVKRKRCEYSGCCQYTAYIYYLV